MSSRLLSPKWLLLGLIVFAGCGGASGGGDGQAASSIPEELSAVPQQPQVALCAQAPEPGFARCHAHIRTDAQGAPVQNQAPSGFVPADLKDAYKLPSSGANGAWVAIVDANDDPNAEADLAVYRQQFGLPPCTTANGCFKKVNQRGVQGSYPAADQGWAGEISLDLDMVSAVCPDCKILLVEADSASMQNLGASVNTAVQLGAAVVSNSYGGAEDASSAQADTQYFNHPGVAILASAGDNGYGAQYPATSQYVTSVGGTSLARSKRNSRGWVEGAWGSKNNKQGGTGSGCSGFVSKPSWQHDTGCSKRMESDVSAVADPNTGVAVYSTFNGQGGWMVVGGTSAASPIVAGIYALTGHANAGPELSYGHTGAFFDVLTGTNGTCSTVYFCNAGAGYDGPTGNGTPNGAALLSVVGGGGTVGNLDGGAAVTFEVDNATTNWGTNVYVLGDVPELGRWDPTHAVPLSAAAYPNWTGTVSLPQGAHVQFKFIKVDGSGNVTWENGSNRNLDVPSAATASFVGTWQ